MGRIPLSFSLVTFDKTDTFGPILSLISLTPIILVFSLFYNLIFYPRIDRKIYQQYLFCFIGLGMNETLNSLLKNAIKQERPVGSERTEYGMPSSHSQFMTFWLFFWFSSLNSVQRILSIIVTALVLYGRVHLAYHTIEQVIAGCLIGVAAGFCFQRILKYWKFVKVEKKQK